MKINALRAFFEQRLKENRLTNFIGLKIIIKSTFERNSRINYQLIKFKGKSFKKTRLELLF